MYIIWSAYLKVSNRRLLSKLVTLLYASPPVWKLHPHGEVISKTYKSAFYGGHLSCNMSYGGAANLWVFCLPR